MNEENKTPAPQEPSPEIKIPAEKVTTINIDDIKPNTVLIINIDVESPMQKMAVAPAFGKLLAPYAAKLREKHVTVMLMTLKESIDLIPEEQMNKAGWTRTDKSIIINPYGK